MPTNKHVVSDGISSRHQTVITAPLDEGDFFAYVEEHNREWDRCGTLDGRVAHLKPL